MKNRLRIALGLLAALCAAPAFAGPVYLYVDSAPNVYGSPDWDGWWATAKADVAAGTFTNLRTGTYPDTTWIDPYDEIVYSTGDLGKRLHWIYWIPDETISTLDGRFERRWVIDWGGTDWTYEGNAWAEAGPDVGWNTPTYSWEDYDADNDGTIDGVIGSIGFAWWADDDQADPYDTGGSPYDETDQADIDALRDTILTYQTYALGQVRLDDEVTGLQVNVVPEPATLLLLGSGLAGIAGCRRRRKQA